jgi:autotransporter family porin
MWHQLFFAFRWNCIGFIQCENLPNGERGFAFAAFDPAARDTRLFGPNPVRQTARSGFGRAFLQLTASFALLCLSEASALAACDTSTNDVTCTGSSGALVIPPPPGPSVTVNVAGQLNGGITVTGIADSFITNNGQINGNITVTGGADFTFAQNGSFGATAINATVTGTNTVIVYPGLSVGNVTLTGAINAIDNGGTVNNALNLTATGQNNVTNREGARLNQITFNAPRNIIENFGTFNSAIQFTQDGVNTINNRSTGIINGITSTGNSADRVGNEGQINGTVSLGAGADWFINVGGSENGNIDMGAGNDTLYMEGGLITSPVDMGSGNDWAAILNGTLSANFQAGSGTDTLHWSGGTITAGVDMGADNDRALFYDLDQTNLATGLPISGGTGTDVMTWNNTTGDGVYRFVNWELIELNRGSEMIFSDFSTLTMGDSGTGTGTLTIDASSRVSAGNGTHRVAPAISGELVTVYNAGLIDLTNSQATTSDRFVVVGNYVGQSGNLNLQTFLGTDDSPSDQLVIQGNGARASGVSVINITNLEGPGAATIANGIRVVDADLAGGAETDAGAFVLGGRVAAGLFEYQLFRGGVGADAGDNDWYLRSEVISLIPVWPTVPVIPQPPPVAPAPLPPLPVSPLPTPPPPPPPPPVEPPTPPTPEIPDPEPPPPPTPPPPPPPPPPVTPQPPAPPPVTPPPPVPPAPPSPPGPVDPPSVPLIRPEVPGYTIAPAIAQQMGLVTLDKFHARQGDEFLLDSRGSLPGGWGRAFGQTSDQAWSPDISGLDFQLDPKFDGKIWGLQAGQDLMAWFGDDGSQDRIGFFYAHTEASGDVAGNTLAVLNIDSGDLSIDGDNIGVYWTHISPVGWYLDAVAMATWLDGSASSNLGVGADISGNSYLASLEGGYALPLGGAWVLEPQGQIIWQRVDLDDTQDPFSSIAYEAFDSAVGRLGLRLEGNTTVSGMKVQPYIDANVWHTFETSYSVVFEDRSVVTGTEGTVLELGAGLSTRFTSAVSGYGGFKFMSGLDGPENESYGGTLGLRVEW